MNYACNSTYDYVRTLAIVYIRRSNMSYSYINYIHTFKVEKLDACIRLLFADPVANTYH